MDVPFNPVQEAHMPGYSKVMELRIHMGCGEYSDNTPMQKLAEDALAALKEKIDQTGIPVVVFVHEHGGWMLGYTYIDNKVEVVYSANDCAQWYGKHKEFREAAYHAKWENIGTVRRPDVERQYN